MIIPELRTRRLLLRGPARQDFDVYCRFYADPDASFFYGGPLQADSVWRRLACDLGHWALRGFGMWSVVEQATARMVGGCGIVWPEGWPRHELTWWITPEARRRGYAFEASQAALDWAYGRLGWQQVETHMDDDNAAARALASKLGGVVTGRERFPDGFVRSIYALPPPSFALSNAVNGSR